MKNLIIELLLVLTFINKQNALIQGQAKERNLNQELIKNFTL